MKKIKTPDFKISYYDSTIEKLDNSKIDIAEWKKIKGSLLKKDSRKKHAGTNTLPIPYTFPAGPVVVAGIFYLKENLGASYTDGTFAGAVIGNYHLDNKDANVCAENGIVKVCLKLRFKKRRIYYRVCTRNWDGRWNCGRWKTGMKF